MSISDLEYPEVDYVRTGLKTVVCQLGFNPILKIGQEQPAEFQDLVRKDFPLFSREESAEFRVGPGPAVEALPRVAAVWRFKTEDEAWTAGLTVNFLSLETSRYENFLDFERRFSILHEALRSIYGVDHYVRVGLRYINTFESDDFPGGWMKWFNPQLLGPMADPMLGVHVIESREALVLADDDWKIAIRHGTEDSHYRLDIDHFIEARVEVKNVPERLRAFNRRAYQVFRWAISEATHEEMEPQDRE